jgi:hypothetical protein
LLETRLFGHELILLAVRYLPSWFPGGGFKSTAIDMRKDRDKFMDEPYNFVLKKLVSDVVVVGMLSSAYTLASLMALLGPLSFNAILMVKN